MHTYTHIKLHTYTQTKPAHTHFGALDLECNGGNQSHDIVICKAVNESMKLEKTI